MSALSVAYEAPSRRMAYRVTAPADSDHSGTSDIGRRIGARAVSRRTNMTAPPVRAIASDRLCGRFPGLRRVVCGRSESGAEGRTTPRGGVHPPGRARARDAALFLVVAGQRADRPWDGVLKSLDRPVTKIVTTPPPDSPQAAGRALRSIFLSTFYMAFGLAILASAFVVVVSSVTRLNVETAVTSAPLEQVVSADVGAIAEMNVRPGYARSRAGQPLFRVDSENAVRNVQQARQELETAQIALRQAAARREDEEKKLADYRAISTDQLAARKGGDTSGDCGARCRPKGAGTLRGALECESNQPADVRQREGELRGARRQRGTRARRTERRLDLGRSHRRARPLFQRQLPGGRNQRRHCRGASGESAGPRGQAAVGNALQQQSKRLYIAPFDAVVAKVFKSRGMTVDRGEALVVLRPTGVEPYIDAFLTQAEAGQLATGSARDSGHHRDRQTLRGPTGDGGPDRGIPERHADAQAAGAGVPMAECGRPVGICQLGIRRAHRRPNSSRSARVCRSP